MHMEEAGIPMETARVMRIAEKDSQARFDGKTARKTLTDITPDRRPINGIVGPGDRINELVEAG